MQTFFKHKKSKNLSFKGRFMQHKKSLKWVTHAFKIYPDILAI